MAQPVPAAPSVSAPEAPAAEVTLWRRIVRHRMLYLMFLPVAVYYIVFRYWPIGLAWIVAFKDLKLGMGVFDSAWVGLDNFRVMFEDPEIVNVLRNTVEISLLRIVVGFFPPIILAIMFHDLSSGKLKKWLQSAVYIPHFFRGSSFSASCSPFSPPARASSTMCWKRWACPESSFSCPRAGSGRS